MSTVRNETWSTGRRKVAIARVRLKPGTGAIVINDRHIDTFFGGHEFAKMLLRQPLVLLEATEKFDIAVNVVGGGVSGQAGAIRHGISRALAEFNPDFRPPLKKAGLLTRDSRSVERKKYGQPGARRRFQFSKR